VSNLYQNLPETPGVYLMKDGNGRILYIGKAGNLKRRVSSYFLRPHDSRIEKLVSEIRDIDYKKTESSLEALILEAELIKKHEPPFNIKEKDDKSFLYVEITDEEFPRVLLSRGKKLEKQSHEVKTRKFKFGPFTSASSIREALRIIRRIFPYNIHPPEKIKKFGRTCFDYEIGLCPGVCAGLINKADYAKNVRNIKLLFEGKKSKILKNLEKEMKSASRLMEFEKAEKLKRQIFALRHIQDVALIADEQIRNSIREPADKVQNSEKRIEGYDISNISGTSAVGSMVVFTNGQPDKNEYRKFRIRTIKKSDDVGMLKEVLRRRFPRTLPAGGWPLPALILIDGGKGQVNGAKKVLEEIGLRIPVIGIAKGAKRKKNEFIGEIPKGFDTKMLIKVRNEAHRFAISYHRALRGRTSLK
jgi:excinuclease ABC subunit C